MNITIDREDLLDIYGIFYPTTAVYIFSLSILGNSHQNRPYSRGKSILTSEKMELIKIGFLIFKNVNEKPMTKR